MGLLGPSRTITTVTLFWRGLGTHCLSLCRGHTAVFEWRIEHRYAPTNVSMGGSAAGPRIEKLRVGSGIRLCDLLGIGLGAKASLGQILHSVWVCDGG